MEKAIKNLALSAFFLVGCSGLAGAADVDICATASCSGQTTTGAITSGAPTLTLGAAKDFTNGQGIRVDHAGAATAVTTPTGLGVSPVGTVGTTSYLYQIAAFDAFGGVSAATSGGGINNGNANLTPNNYNDLTFAAGAGPAPVGYCVWRNVAGAGYVWLKMVNNTEFWDWGTTDARPSWCPATPPAGALSKALITTVSSGGGTTTLTLGANAGTTVSGQTVAHDDTVQLTTAITNLNAAGGGYNLYCSGSAQIRYSTQPGIIAVPNSHLVSSPGPGCTLLPYGNFIAMEIKGNDLGAACTLSADVIEGSTTVPLVSSAGFNPGDFVVLQQPAPSNLNAPNVYYTHISPIRSISANTATIIDPSPFFISPSNATIAVTGSWLPGDSITISLSGAATPSSLRTVIVTGRTNKDIIAADVATNINQNATNGVFAYSMVDGGSVNRIVIVVPAVYSSTVSVVKTSAGGAVAATQHDTTNTATICNRWVANVHDVGVRDITVDGTDSTGIGVYLTSVADWDVKGIRTKNMHFGAAVYTSIPNYYGVADDLLDNGSGSSAVNFTSAATFWFTGFTVLQQTNIRCRFSKSFGCQEQSGGWLQTANSYQSGADAGRGHKIEGLGGVAMTNIASHNATYADFALAYGLRRASISNLFSYGGDRALDANGECIWSADMYDTLIRFFGVHTAGCREYDVTFFTTDIRNSMVGAVINGGNALYGLGGVYNAGFARFWSTNGFDRAGGMDGQTYINGVSAGLFSPTPLYNVNQ